MGAECQIRTKMNNMEPEDLSNAEALDLMGGLKPDWTAKDTEEFYSTSTKNDPKIANWAQELGLISQSEVFAQESPKKDPVACSQNQARQQAVDKMEKVKALEKKIEKEKKKHMKYNHYKEFVKLCPEREREMFMKIMDEYEASGRNQKDESVAKLTSDLAKTIKTAGNQFETLN